MGIFSWFGGGDAEEITEPDTDTRVDAALKVAGTTDPVETWIPGWGDHEGDHSDREKTLSWEHTEVDDPYFDRAAIYSYKPQQEDEEG